MVFGDIRMKVKTRLALSLIIVLALAIPMVSNVSAQGTSAPGSPGHTEPTEHPSMPTTTHDPRRMPHRTVDNQGVVWISTDIITVMATPQFPMFHFWYTTDNNGSMARFILAYPGIAEFEDLNGDGAFQRNETLRFASLATYEWVVQTGSVVEDGVTTEVWISYTKGGLRTEGPVPGAPTPALYRHGTPKAFEDVSIQVLAHIYLNDYHGNVSDSRGVHLNYTVAGGSELKMDIIIGNFPFSTNTSMVALQTLLRENVAHMDQSHNRHRYMTREHNRTFIGDSSAWPDHNQSETRFERRHEAHLQQVDLIDESNVTQGFFRWVDKALITWPGGASEIVNVTASYTPSDNGLVLYLAYPHFDDGTLMHDPSIGLFEDGAPLVEPLLSPLVIGGIVVVVVLVAIAGAVRRRR